MSVTVHSEYFQNYIFNRLTIFALQGNYT